MTNSGLGVVMFPSASDAAERLLAEVARAVAQRVDALLSFDAGVTFEPFLQRLAEACESRSIGLDHVRVTHLREFLGFDPAQENGMVFELLRLCSPLRAALEEERFLLMPAGDVDRAGLVEHRQRLDEAGGVDLQLLGLGPNGFLGGCESGTPFAHSFHVSRLPEPTRQRMGWRFAPSQAPSHVVTSGPSDILASRRLVVLATGEDKAAIVQEILEGPMDGMLPASIVRRHPNALIVVDEAAGALLEWPEPIAATS